VFGDAHEVIAVGHLIPFFPTLKGPGCDIQAGREFRLIHSFGQARFSDSLPKG
jgi:hypothetical protein